MLTQQMSLAYDELKKLEAQIKDAEANIRVLDAIGNPNVIQLRSNLANAKQQRDQLMAAIDAEANAP